MAAKQQFRIFVGSPGDVGPERAAAEKVIKQLQVQSGSWVDLVWDLYENKALPAHEPPQRNIPDPATADVAIFLFWHSVGSQPLSEEFRLTDGSLAASGTLWEFDRAYFGIEQDGKIRRPWVLAYKKTDPIGVASAEESVRATQGFDSINAFAKKYIHDVTFHGYWTKYDGNALEDLLRRHLTDWLSKHIPNIIAASQELPTWTQDKSPFPGLVSFTEEYASQFYGREQKIVEVCNKVEEAEQGGKYPFLIVTGSSGVGKSSLLKAGVVPELRRRALEKGYEFRSVVFRPSESGSGAMHSLAEAILSEGGLHELRQQPSHDTAEFADQLRRKPDVAAYRIAQAITSVRPLFNQPDQEEQEKESEPKSGTLHDAKFRFVLVVDQFEELFAQIQSLKVPTSQLVTDWEEASEVSIFASTLVTLAEQFGFVVLGSMRDDFLPNLNNTLELNSVAMHGLIGIGPVSSAELHKIIEFPVRAAGFEFEHILESNQSLADIICQEANQLGPHGLPMVQFVMQAMFERARAATIDPHILKNEYYNALGRVKGVLERAASSAYGNLSYTDREEARRLFLDLISVGPENSANAAGRVREFDLKRKSAAFNRCVSLFVKVRLLVQSSSTNPDTIRLSIAHEALIQGWKDLKDWIDDNKTMVVLATLVEDQANMWNERGRKQEYLVLSGDELDAAEDLVWIEKSVNERDVVGEYVKACTRKLQWRRLWAVAGLFVLMAWGFTYSLRDLQFRSHEEIQRLTLGASALMPVIIVNLLGKWWALPQATQRRLRAGFWSLAFLLIYSLWCWHQSNEISLSDQLREGLFFAWLFLFPAAYNLNIARIGPLQRIAHRAARMRWMSLYFSVLITYTIINKISQSIESEFFRLCLVIVCMAAIMRPILKLRGRILGHGHVKRKMDASENGRPTLFIIYCRNLMATLNWAVPPLAIGIGLFLMTPTLQKILGENHRNSDLLTAPVPATFFVPDLVVLNPQSDYDSGAWWHAVIGPNQKTVVGMTAAREGECDSKGYPESLWGHLRRLGLTEGGLAVKGGCKVGRNFDRDRLVEEFVYSDIEKPLVRRVLRDGGFDLYLTTDDGVMYRHGRLVQLVDGREESKWLYEAFTRRKLVLTGVPVSMEPIGDRRIWSYSKSANAFRVMRVDEAMRPKRFDEENFSTLEIGRDKAGRLATLSYLDPSGEVVADASGAHQVEFSYSSRGLCKTAVAMRPDGSELFRRPCGDERLSWLKIED